MGHMDSEPAFWNGRQWVPQRIAPTSNSDIDLMALMTESPESFTTEQLRTMVDAAPADLQSQGQLPIDSSVGPNVAFDHALDMDETSLWPGPQRPEEIESGAGPRPVEFPREDVSPMSMDHGLKLIDAWMAEQEVRAFDDALDINLGTKRNKRRYDEVEWDVASRHQAKFQRHIQRNEGLVSENGFLSDWQNQTPSTMGFWNGGAHNIAQSHEMTPEWRMSQYEELGCRAAVAEPGSQTPGVAVNGMARRRPQLKLPSDIQGAMASGSHHQKVLNEAPMAVAASTSNNPTTAQRADKPEQEFECSECTELEGKPVTFKSERSLRSHLAGTRKHGAPPVLRCGCGAEAVVRKDAKRVHRRSCSAARNS